MPKVDHLAKLLEAVASQSWVTAKAAATRIVEAEEEKGHHAAAEFLRASLHPNGQRSPSPNGVATQANGSGTWIAGPSALSSALTRLSGATRIADVQLRRGLEADLHAVLVEWRHRDALAAKGIERRRKLLFHGPPGCGKSLTALALGNEIGAPTYVVRIDAVVGAYLGQTALRIRELFHFAETTDCVLLLDEIDALGKRRGSPLDVGELDRVVISLMQELEHTLPRCLVVATSNVPKHLDDALFRRFDGVLTFPRPTSKELARFGRSRAVGTGVIPPAKAARLVSGATSFAEAARRILAEERAAVLREIAD